MANKDVSHFRPSTRSLSFPRVASIGVLIHTQDIFVHKQVVHRRSFFVLNDTRPDLNHLDVDEMSFPLRTK
jgi:hypothetical protein